MKARALFQRLAAGCLLAVPVGSAIAQSPKAKSFDDFPLVKSRNIFDPNRRAVRMESSRESRTSSNRITRANTLSLTGTMVADGRALAFFGGSRSEYSKIIGVGDTVADHKVKAITTTDVELEHGGKTSSLAVGTFLTLEGTVEVDAPPTADTSPESSTAAAPSTDTAPATAPSGDKNDVLRRMMERRAKEMTK